MSFLSKLHVKQPQAPIIWRDNLSTVMLSVNPVLHTRTKHIELDLFFVREKVVRKEIEVRNTTAQVADVLTKPAPSSKFLLWHNKLRVEDLTALKLRGYDSVRTLVLRAHEGTPAYSISKLNYTLELNLFYS